MGLLAEMGEHISFSNQLPLALLPLALLKGYDFHMIAGYLLTHGWSNYVKTVPQMVGEHTCVFYMSSFES